MSNNDDTTSSPTPLNSWMPRNNKIYSEKQYWEDRFEKEKEFEWLNTYADVRHLIRPMILEYYYDEDNKPLEILIVGCGNSKFSYDLYLDIPREMIKITNIDYSKNVIDNMQRKYPELEWIEMDMTDMKKTFQKKTFDIIIDKAAMDAFVTTEKDVWNPDVQVVKKCYTYLHEVSSLMKTKQTGGTTLGSLYLHISFAQPHFRSKYLLGLLKDTRNECDEDNDQHEIESVSTNNDPDEFLASFSLVDDDGSDCDSIADKDKDNDDKSIASSSKDDNDDSASQVSNCANNNYSDKFGWTLKVESIQPRETQQEQDNKSSGCFHHFLYIMKK